MTNVRVIKTFIDRKRERQDLELDPCGLEDVFKLCRSVSSSMGRATVKTISFENLDREWMEGSDVKYKGSQIKFMGRKSKGVIDVPEYMPVHDALRIFNIGYGRALAHSIRYIREHFPEHEEILKKELLSKLEVYKIHLVRDS